MTASIRRPDVAGVSTEAALAALQEFAEDVIARLEERESRTDVEFDLVQVLDWAEDGETKSILTSVQNPRVIVAQAVEKTDTTTVLATGSVSFSATGIDDASGFMGVDITDISGLSSATTYEVSLYVVGEV